MAIAEMKKLLLVGLEDERAKVFKALHRMGNVEVVGAKSIETGISNENEPDVFALGKTSAEGQISALQLKIAKLKFAFAFLKSQKIIIKKAAKQKVCEYQEPKRNFGAKPTVTFEQFVSACEKEGEVFETILQLESLSEVLTQAKTSQIKAKTLLEQVLPYEMIDAKFSDFCDTSRTSFMLGMFPTLKRAEFEQILTSGEYCFAEYFESKRQTVAVVVCLKSFKESLYEKLSGVDFALCNINTPLSAKEIIYDCRQKLKEIEVNKLEIAKAALEFENELDEFRLMFDFYNVEMQKAESSEKTLCSAKTFVLEAWVPQFAQEKFEEKFSQSKLATAFEFSDPKATEVPPTLCRNNGLVAPYESVTNMYSSPTYSELDPNPFVSFFFILFFGMMVSDAGYGLLMTVGTAVILCVKRFRKGEGNIIKVLLAGGLSTIFWGIMFGSYFGMELIKPVMFSPLANPLAMMGLALGLGLVQMVFGMALNAYQLFKHKKPWEAILGVFSWYAVFLGLGCLVMGMMLKIKTLSTLSYVFLALGFSGVLLYGARGKKGFKKVTGAFGNVYQAINIMSDLLSYTRLFGLGLATGVIGMVVNQIAGVIQSMIPGVGIIFAILIGIVGHAFNIGINVLGAYVHNARLQYVEFFGKFYTGGAKLFDPLGSNMKYYNIQE